MRLWAGLISRPRAAAIRPQKRAVPGAELAVEIVGRVARAASWIRVAPRAAECSSISLGIAWKVAVQL